VFFGGGFCFLVFVVFCGLRGREGVVNVLCSLGVWLRVGGGVIASVG